jgi:hypothetical protein
MKLFACLMAVVVCLMSATSAVAGETHPNNSCVPLSGTLYGWFNGSWQSVGDLRVGRSVLHVEMAAVTTIDSTDGGVLRGSEKWTLDFGRHNTVLADTDFVGEHLADAVAPSRVFHVIELGMFTGGTGIFKNAYGSFISSGPFGPSVTLPDSIQSAPDSQMWWIGPIQGTICGLNERR